jgi:MFS family permease
MTSALSSFFLIRLGYRKPMIIGVLLLSVSLASLSPGFHNASVLGVRIPDLVLLALLMMIGAVGMGISGPAANNAALDLVPDKVAAIAGMRGMFRSTGGVLGTATIILGLSHYDDKASGLQQIFLILSVAILTLIPLVFLIPDAARRRRLGTQELDRTTVGPATEPGREVRREMAD